MSLIPVQFSCVLISGDVFALRRLTQNPRQITLTVALKKLPLSLNSALAGSAFASYGCTIRRRSKRAGKVCDQTAHLAFVCHPLQQRRRSVLLEEFLFSLLKSCFWRELASLHHTKLRFRSRRVRL